MSVESGVPGWGRADEDKVAAGGAGTITRALGRVSSGEDRSMDELIQLVYEELSRLARSYLRRERDDHTLDTRALVHEAYARMIGQRRVEWQNRRHFFGIAAQHMRRILCDYARQRQADKRGGGQKLVRLTGLDEFVAGAVEGMTIDEIINLDQILNRLEKRDIIALEIVHLRCILGFNMSEISKETGIPIRTLSRKWRWARAWLVAELRVVESQPPL